MLENASYLARAVQPTLDQQPRELDAELSNIDRRIALTARYLLADFHNIVRVKTPLSGAAGHRRIERDRAVALDAAERASAGKSRLLIAASHDLRGPLESLSLFHGAVRDRITDDQILDLLDRSDQTIASMASTLNALLAIDRLENGSIRQNITDFPINALFERLESKFGLCAAQRGLRWRVDESRLTAHADPRLLEQALRALISNAFRYSNDGGVLLGCRRRAEILNIEISGTDIGISTSELAQIFDDKRHGYGPSNQGDVVLGLVVTKRLLDLLGCSIEARTDAGGACAFVVRVPMGRDSVGTAQRFPRAEDKPRRNHAAIALVVAKDDTECEALGMTLARGGHRTIVAKSAVAALALASANASQIDVIITEFALSRRVDFVQFVSTMRASLDRAVPVVILCEASESLDDLAVPGSLMFTKPVQREGFLSAVQQALDAPFHDVADPIAAPATVCIVDEDRETTNAMRQLLERNGYRVQNFATASDFLAAAPLPGSSCLITDLYIREMNGFELLARLATAGIALPTIVMTGRADVPTAVQAMRAGAADFIEKPISAEVLLASIAHTLRVVARPEEHTAWRAGVAARAASLTKREREVLDLVVAGRSNKETARHLGINQRTIEAHRAAVMRKMRASSLPELVRLELLLRRG